MYTVQVSHPTFDDDEEDNDANDNDDDDSGDDGDDNDDDDDNDDEENDKYDDDNDDDDNNDDDGDDGDDDGNDDDDDDGNGTVFMQNLHSLLLSSFQQTSNKGIDSRTDYFSIDYRSHMLCQLSIEFWIHFCGILNTGGYISLSNY